MSNQGQRKGLTFDSGLPIMKLSIGKNMISDKENPCLSLPSYLGEENQPNGHVRL